MLRLKRVYDAPDESDGLRVLVDRLWPRGLSRERARVDLWLREVAPSTELRRWVHEDAERWEAFRERYRAELAGSGALERLREEADRGPVTLLYASSDTRRNNAVALREILAGTQ